MRIDNITRDILENLIGMQEQINVAKATGYSVSTVRNIMFQRVKINRFNKKIVTALIDAALAKLDERKRLDTHARSHFRNINYNNI